MTSDDYDHVDRHTPPSDEGTEGKHSKRGRLIDALNRTKTKLQHAKEEREARKHSKDSQQPEFKLDDDVNDFLAAGRTSFTSSRPSFGSATVPQSEDSSAIYGSRPSTSDSKSQVSPRRGPPIVPRIDVSTSSRFPNARTVHPDDRLPILDDAQTSPRAGSLLAPEYKSRSMSSSSILSKERRQRVRGLSVGFADAPPVIIGEGGDEAQAPPVEISRAKARARSASPQGRKTYTDPAPQGVARMAMSARGISDNNVGFVPRPLARVQTGAAGLFQRGPRGPHDDDLFSPVSNQAPTFEHQPPLPARNPNDFQSIEQKPPPPHRNSNSFQPIGRINTGGLELAKEFEMTMGFASSSESSPVTRREPPQQSMRIAAPTPQRAPPSYDLLEHGRVSQADIDAESPNLDGQQYQQQSMQPRVDDLTHALHRRPVPIHSVQDPESFRSLARSEARSLPPQQQEAYFPPPPQRQTTVVKKNIQKLEPIQPRSGSRQQESGTPPKAPLQLVTEVDDGYRSFAERQKANTMASVRSDAANTVRHITTRDYEQSPEYYMGSKEATPHTATNPTPTTKRFYETFTKAPEGMI